MPLLSFKSKINVPSSPEVISQNRPLIYAEPASTPIIDVNTVETTNTRNTRPATHRARTDDVFADITYYKQQKAKAAAAAKAKADSDAGTKQARLLINTENIEDTGESEASFER